MFFQCNLFDMVNYIMFYVHLHDLKKTNCVMKLMKNSMRQLISLILLLVCRT